MRNAHFHILQSTDSHHRFHLVAELCEKLYQAGKSVLIYADLANLLQPIDHALWSFKNTSFLPHNKLDTNGPQTSIQLAHGDQEAQADVLINLSEHVPNIHTNFAEVFEVVDQNPINLSNTRRHYKFYQDEGWEMQTSKH